MRKTVNVKEVVAQANERLAGWTKTAEERHGIIEMTRAVLSMADAYDGFGYLTFDELRKGAFDCAAYNKNETGTIIDVRPGVRSENIMNTERMVDGVDTWFEDTDETRIKFFIHRKLG